MSKPLLEFERGKEIDPIQQWKDFEKSVFVLLMEKNPDIFDWESPEYTPGASFKINKILDWLDESFATDLASVKVYPFRADGLRFDFELQTMDPRVPFNPSNNWESLEYPKKFRMPLNYDVKYERHRKFKMSQEFYFDEYLRGCRPDRVTVKPFGKTGLLIETYKAEERDPCEGNQELKEIQRRCNLEREFMDGLGKNWLDKEEQRKEREYIGGSVTNKMRSRLQKQDIKVNPPDGLFVYVNLDKRIVTTWTGEKVGSIIKQGRPYQSNWGDERVNITADVFGIKYTGTYFKSSGDYARLKRQNCHNIALHILPACRDGFYREWQPDGSGICVQTQSRDEQ